VSCPLTIWVCVVVSITLCALTCGLLYPLWARLVRPLAMSPHSIGAYLNRELWRCTEVTYCPADGTGGAIGCRQHWAPDASSLCSFFHVWDWVLFVLCFASYWGASFVGAFFVAGVWYRLVQRYDPSLNLTLITRNLDTQLAALEDDYRQRIAASDARLRELSSYQPPGLQAGAYRAAPAPWLAWANNPNCVIT
jgi:hypothetical protein